MSLLTVPSRWYSKPHATLQSTVCSWLAEMDVDGLTEQPARRNTQWKTESPLSNIEIDVVLAGELTTPGSRNGPRGTGPSVREHPEEATAS